MEPKRNWLPGDAYWALWINHTERRYFPRFEGVVDFISDGIIRFSGGGWRFVSEGLPFGSQEDAERYAAENKPVGEAPARSTYGRVAHQLAG
jgi:hypothetical protein